MLTPGNSAERSGRIVVTLLAIVLPLKRLQVGEIVRSIFCYRADVINLPAGTVWSCVAVLGPVDRCIANIFAPHTWVNAGNDCRALFQTAILVDSSNRDPLRSEFGFLDTLIMGPSLKNPTVNYVAVDSQNPRAVQLERFTKRRWEFRLRFMGRVSYNSSGPRSSSRPISSSLR